ncbi:MraY family glycosyltransferase (plasmid) [Rossellomorea sp. AcN35-11]|nr:undecaprenyl/decaprenyl-phosphate alpha-N-acetylglucosaminyl 1-phosphate transferase [Rossellomorea aquimaris]WJV32153.1 MraY family glycosyltransferase [Rossellomorea sp. AcN35-11]
MAILFLTPLMILVAKKLNIVDQPNNRKVHTKSVPLLGGLAIYLSYFVSYGLLVIFTDNVATNIGYGILIGGLVMVITGLVDDIYDIKPVYKMFGQVMAALIAMEFGLLIERVSIPLIAEPIQLGWIGIPITILWVLAITNAVNLLDGLDGLASGVSGIAVASLFFVSLSIGHTHVAMVALIIVGTIMGFLHFNFNPAKIFMGDTGSLFLGFSLACLSLLNLKEATFISLLIPVLILSVPISDTFFAIVRRKVKRVPFSSADKNHLHHQLLKMGMTQKQAVLLIYSISVFFGLLSVLSVSSAFWVSILIFSFYLFFFYIIAECIGLISENYRPLINTLNRVVRKRK